MTNHPDIRSSNKHYGAHGQVSLFIITLIALVIAGVWVVTIPLTVIGIIYLVRLRGQVKESAEVLGRDQGHIAYLESERSRLTDVIGQERSRIKSLHDDLERIDAMSVLRREEHIAELDDRVSEKTMDLQKYSDVLDDIMSIQQREDRKERLDQQISDAKQSLGDYKQDIAAKKSDIVALREQVVDLQASIELNDFGLYNFENPAQDSVKLGKELKRVQDAIKAALKTKSATHVNLSFNVNGSQAQGQKMVNDMSKLLLRAFNSEAENCIGKVRAGNLTVGIKRLDRSAEAVQRLGKSMSIRITDSFLEMRKTELRLTHQHMEALKEAKEEERAVREREREEARAQKELEAAKAKQAKEVEHYRTVLSSLEAMGDDDEIKRITERLTEAEGKLADVETTMANTRAGYVYVISNLGAFGRGMVKIGMTRRLNPDDRIRELGDSSVPFLFDKHAMFFSQDAVGVENLLHKHFADRRVNLVNMRREYFYATPSEVREALDAHDVQMLEFHEPADAPEFEQSKLVRQRNGLPPVPALALAGLMEDSEVNAD